VEIKMKIEINSSTSEKRPVVAETNCLALQRTLSPWRGKIAEAIKSSLTAGMLFIAAGCSANNFNFNELSELSAHSRTERLGEALALGQTGGETRDLYDMKMTPLLHTHLNVFARADEEGIPAGFVEADIDACLPFFGFVDATVNRYDHHHQMYEGHEFDSYFWGLFQKHRERIVTPTGMREKRTKRFLWLFSWGSSPEYVEVTE